MVTDGQVRKLRRLLSLDENLASAAGKTGMDEKTARKYRELTVHWYDGGRRPRAPEGMPPRRDLDANGAIFVGDKGTLTCGDVVNVNDPDDDIPMLLPESRWKSFEPPKKVDRLAGSWEHDWLGNHEHLWLEACKKGEQPCSHFEYSAALTEMVLLGNVALQAG